MKNTLKILLKVVVMSILGIIIGIILGLAFGTLIAYITTLIDGGKEEMPLAAGAFLGMGAGAFGGGLFAGIVGYKN